MTILCEYHSYRIVIVDNLDHFSCQTLTTVLIKHAAMADRVWMVSATTHVAVHQGIRVIIAKGVSSRSSKFNYMELKHRHSLKTDANRKSNFLS